MFVKRNKKFQIFLIVTVIIGVFVFLRFQNSTTLTKTTQVKEKISVIQTVQLPGGVINQKITIEKNKTALDLLRSTTKLETSGKDELTFVVSINGRSANSKKKEYWAFIINNKPAEIGAGSYLLQDNDHILWEIKTF